MKLTPAEILDDDKRARVVIVYLIAIVVPALCVLAVVVGKEVIRLLS